MESCLYVSRDWEWKACSCCGSPFFSVSQCCWERRSSVLGLCYMACLRAWVTLLYYLTSVWSLWERSSGSIGFIFIGMLMILDYTSLRHEVIDAVHVQDQYLKAVRAWMGRKWLIFNLSKMEWVVSLWLPRVRTIDSGQDAPHPHLLQNWESY